MLHKRKGVQKGEVICLRTHSIHWAHIFVHLRALGVEDWGQMDTVYTVYVWVRGEEQGKRQTLPTFDLANIYSTAIMCQVLGYLGVPREQNLFPAPKELRDKEIDNYSRQK